MSPLSASGTVLLVGLGNPGRSYERTRHNSGFLVIDRVSEALAIGLDRRKKDILFGKGRTDGREVILAKPTAFMNRSGPPVQRLLQFFKVPIENLFAIHDDMDLAFGRLQVRPKGSAAGHRGVESLVKALGSGGFARLRIGVGRPEAPGAVTRHVLGRFTAEEGPLLDQIISRAVAGVLLVLKDGIEEGMNQINNRKLLISH